MSKSSVRLLAAGGSALLIVSSLVAMTPSAMADPPPTGDQAPAVSSWMQQPDAVALLKEMTAAQTDFETAHRTQLAAEKTVSTLDVQISARRSATLAATAQIERYARSAYLASADSQNFGSLTNLLEDSGADGLAQGEQSLGIVGSIQARELEQAVAELGQVQAMRSQQQQVQADALLAMSQAKSRGQAVLDKLSQLLGPAPQIGQQSVTATTCPKTAPAGSLTDGSAAIGIEKLCLKSVKQARTPAAAAAIVWAFNHLGEPYNSGGVPIDVENFGSFNCATFVAKAFFWGARIAGFLELPWTPAYASPPASIRGVGAEHQAGDINIMWRSVDIADSGGQAGHAQLFIADGWVIQSGGTGSSTNIARYPNGWPGWQETHFALATP